MLADRDEVWAIWPLCGYILAAVAEMLQTRPRAKTLQKRKHFALSVSRLLAARSQRSEL
jgi:hypothetical protein